MPPVCFKICGKNGNDQKKQRQGGQKQKTRNESDARTCDFTDAKIRENRKNTCPARPKIHPSHLQILRQINPLALGGGGTLRLVLVMTVMFRHRRRRLSDRARPRRLKRGEILNAKVKFLGRVFDARRHIVNVHRIQQFAFGRQVGVDFVILRENQKCTPPERSQKLKQIDKVEKIFRQRALIQAHTEPIENADYSTAPC
jgi:hypothetical protein